MRAPVLIFAMLFTIPNFGQWVPVYQLPTFEYNLNDVFTLTESTAIVIGNDGIILKTVDGGDNWVFKTSGVSEKLNRIVFVNSSTGFCMGDNGVLLKTIDGGENWTTQSDPFTFLTGIACINENIIYLVDNYNLKKSIDGGNNFTLVNDSQIRTIQFINEFVGFAEGKKTIDGGITWTDLPIDTYSYEEYFLPMYFINESVGYVMSGNQLSRTSDAGQTFNDITSFTNLHLFNLYATSADVVWTATIPMLDFSDCYTSRVKVSFDNNLEEQIDYGPCLKAMHFSDPSKGFAIDWNGGILKNVTGTMLGIEQVSQNEGIKVYPNPASEQITVTFPEKRVHDYIVEIAEVSGKKVYTKSYQTEHPIVIETSMFARGIYFISIINQEYYETKKIIIR